MFRPRIGQQLLMALAIGLILMPALSWATTTVQKPFNTYTSTPASLSVVNSLTIANDGTPAPGTTYFGTLDLKNNDLIIHPSIQDSAHGLAAYQAAYDMIRSGADQGAYDMKGISSSTVAFDAGVKGGLAIGVLYNDDAIIGGAGNTPIWGATSGANISDLGPFDGYSNISQFDTIIKYTFIGDSFLEGSVSQSDVSSVFPHLGNTSVQWPNNTTTSQLWAGAGDYYYQVSSGAAPINQTDYSQAFTNLSLQNTGYAYTAGVTGASLASGLSVPEPSSIFMAVLGGIGVLLGGFRARSKNNAAVD